MASSKSLEHQFIWLNLYLMLCSHGSEITMLYDIYMCKQQITGHTEMASCYSGTLY